MNKTIIDRKRELHFESFRLRKLCNRVSNYKIQRRIREEQNDLYKRLKFYENFEKASRKLNGI